MLWLIKKIRNIIIGTWYNVFRMNNEIAMKRLVTCYGCEYCVRLTNGINICKQCGCVLESKARVNSEKCKMKL